MRLSLSQSLIRGICLQVRNLTLLAFYLAFHFMYRKGNPFMFLLFNDNPSIYLLNKNKSRKQEVVLFL